MKFTPWHLLVFIALVVGFYILVGPPDQLPEGSSMSQRGINRAWLHTFLLFTGAAGCACFGDKEYGLFPPTSLRWLFITIGVLGMLATAAWMHALQTR